jgi:ABC-2 type transport system permease protein
VDALIGDESVIELRSRRAKHRTLTRFEAWNRTFLEDANEEQKKAADEADDELEKRREQLRERVKEIDEDDSIDPIAKTQMLQQAQEAEQQRMDLAKAQIDQRKDDQIRKINANTKRQQQSLQAQTRFWAVCLPPIPALLVGLFVFIKRWNSEKRNVVASRRRHH